MQYAESSAIIYKRSLKPIFMKKCLILLVLMLVFSTVNVKAQFKHLTTSHYANSQLRSDGSWKTSDWISSPGGITKYDNYFGITIKNEESIIDIISEMEMQVDEEGYFQRNFDCIDSNDIECQVVVVIDPLDSKIVRCELWYSDAALAFLVSGEE